MEEYSNAEQFVMPSIPGADIYRENWFQRQQKGFARTKPSDGNRPSTANSARSVTQYSWDQFGSSSPANGLIRPGTAGGQRPSRVYSPEMPKRTPSKLIPVKPRYQRAPPIVIPDNYEPMVCRFSGFFYESRHLDMESPLGLPDFPEAIMRRFIINFFVRDSTTDIFEVKVKNSGKTKLVFFYMSQRIVF